MAIQAQHPSYYDFSPDIRNQPRAIAGEDMHTLKLQMLPEHQRSLLIGGNAYGLDCNKNANGAVLSDLQKSELTCNKSGSRKRAREEPSMALPRPNDDCISRKNVDSQFFPVVSSQPLLYHAAVAPMVAPFKLADGSFVSGNDPAVSVVGLQSRMLESACTSTSGRPAVSSSTLHVAAALPQDLVSHLYHQNLEIDALVRLQSERLRFGLEEARKRHCRALLTTLEQQTLKRLKEKVAELEAANRRNAELEEKLRQLATENQVWFNVAKNNEAIVSSLRSSLEQVLLQNADAVVALSPAKEGFGDSDGTLFPADDAQSCCFEGDNATIAERRADVNPEAARRRKACKACGDRDVCVLLLPCRHLCLCKECESKVDTCPICKATRNASLQVDLS